jgi:integrase
MNSYDIRFWQIETRKGQTVTYRVRWVVAGRRFSDSFTTKELAESYRAELRAAARRGEGFDTGTGLPESMARTLRDVSFYKHCAEFAAATWKVSAAKQRASVIETLTRIVPVVVADLKGAPEDAILRSALRKKLNQGGHAGELDEDETRAVSWIERASLPVGSVADPAVVCDILDALTVNLNGKPAAPEYFSRRRRVMHRVLAYAVRKKRLEANPLSKVNLPEGWTPPQAPDDTLDPRSVGSPALVASMLETCKGTGRRQGRRFAAFYGCMFYAMMRPSEVAALTRGGCELPAQGWGHLTFADSSTSAGRAYTDDGQMHEHRGLKGRTRGRPTIGTRKPARRVPVPPELVVMLREHLDLFGTAPDGRLFRSENGNPIQQSTWWQVWQKVRKASLSAEELAGPLMRRPYDLRHSGVTWRLNSGVPATEVAAWAGHSVEVLMRVYARCVTGLEDVWISRMDGTLRLGDAPPDRGPQLSGGEEDEPDERS